MSDVQEQIQQIIDGNQVVLFMKGTRMFPQCGFSARSVELLKSCGVRKFKDVNVLADPAIRQGIKDFSNWPTIPQCYIDGKFVGGSDILIEMYENGELHQLLGAEEEAVLDSAPQITLTSSAQEAFSAAMGDAGDDVLRFEVSPSFDYELYFGPKKPGDWAVQCGELVLHVAKTSAARANGTVIDFVDGPDGKGFKIDNPNEPPSVHKLSPKDLKSALAGGKDLHLFDVRSDKERGIGSIAGSIAFDHEARASLEALDKGEMVVFYCHHGVRSRSAAQEWVEKGYRNVHNLTGGIDAWSLQIDTSIARY